MDYKCLLAIANSKLLWWFLKMTGDTLQGDARRVKTGYLNPFPIPAFIDDQLANETVALVSQILDNKRVDPESDTKDDENKLNELVYKMYGLEEAEIIEIERVNQ